ncbi:hypothetical protein ABZZ37_18665 [Streptomyces sp. NPDC006464]|uniref:RICIN domain-containing protein n=1 Tax=Streptomyces sp. NPDC006464 TaxID=3154305 RepID=UPI0033A9B0AE
MDRSNEAWPILVSGRYGNTERVDPVDVIRWPLNYLGEGCTSTITAEAAYSSPLHQMQGVATDGTYYYMSGQCDTNYMGDANTVDWGSYACIWQAKPGQGVSILTRVPSLTQNLSYSRSSGRLWSMNELTNNRSVVSMLPRELDRAVVPKNDYSALCAGVGSKLKNSDPVIQWTCNGAQDEGWLFEETTDNNGALANFLRNAYSGKCCPVRTRPTEPQ